MFVKNWLNILKDLFCFIISVAVWLAAGAVFLGGAADFGAMY